MGRNGLKDRLAIASIGATCSNTKGEMITSIESGIPSIISSYNLFCFGYWSPYTNIQCDEYNKKRYFAYEANN